jgi:hypothetical protein
MFTVQILFCARPNRIPGTENIYYIRHVWIDVELAVHIAKR